jgi:molybdate transport system substrate-binding protein
VRRSFRSGLPRSVPPRSAPLLAALLLAASCGRDNADAPELLVAAASDLALAMPELAAAFEAASGVRVVATLGSSGQLAQQILAGAPVDVFLSADASFVTALVAAGRVDAAGRSLYARGVLVLVTAPRRRTPYESLEALAADPVMRIAIANPEHAPYGRAAREALQAAGVWERLAGRVIVVENVRQAMQVVATGNAEAALAALALVDDRSPAWVPVDTALHAPLLQEAAVIAGRLREADAVAFLRFLTSDEGRAILARHRFLPPGEPP